MPQHPHRLLRLLPLPLLALAAHAAQAADKPAAPAPANTQAPLVTPPEPKVEVIVLEDDNTRIGLRVRGQAQTAKVTPKDSKLPSYEIILPDGGRDMSSGSVTRGAAGKRVWKLLTF